MKEEVAKAWVEALRSGRYQQGHNSLKNVTGFCCLGVLCDISGLGQWERAAAEVECMDGEHLYTVGMDSGIDTLPTAVKEWAGVASFDPELPLSIPLPMSYLNDADRLTFEQIAEHIEEHWQSL